MKRLKATVSLIVLCALFVPLLLPPESLAAKTGSATLQTLGLNNLPV